MAKISFGWEADERYYREKTDDWFWALWIIAITCAVAAIIFHDLLFGILILVAAFTLHLASLRPPRKISCEVNEDGIKVGQYFYPYEMLESFSIDTQTVGSNKLILKTKKIFVPFVTAPLENVGVRELADFLGKHLKRGNLREPLLQKIMDRFGF